VPPEDGESEVEAASTWRICGGRARAWHAEVADPRAGARQFGAFLDLHRMILDDLGAVRQAPRGLIRSRRCNAAWALVQQEEKLNDRFRRDGRSPYLARSARRKCSRAVERGMKLQHKQHQTKKKKTKKNNNKKKKKNKTR